MTRLRPIGLAMVLALLAGFGLPGGAAADPLAPPGPGRPLAGLHRVNIFGEDDRSRDLRRPGSAAGRIVLIVDPTTDKAGTGFLIAPCYAMSAMHVVLSDYDLGARAGPGVNFAYTVYYGLGRLFGNFEGLTIGRPVAWGHYFAAEPVDASQDWIILQLEDCVGERYGHFRVTGLGAAEARAIERLQLAGYPRTEVAPYEHVQRDPACAVHGTARLPLNNGSLWLHDCAMRQGASGSPIFYEDGGAAHAVAIAIGEFRATDGVLPAYDQEHANIAVPAGNFIHAVEALGAETPDRVAEAQRLLNRLGRSVGDADGVAGPMTRLAIHGYRALHGLRPGGLISDALLESLRTATPGP